MATSSRTARKTAPSGKSPARPARKKAVAPPAARKPRAAPAKSGPAPAPAPAANAASAENAADAEKDQAKSEPKKMKLVRDSFTLPKVEYGVIDILKTRAARLSRPAKKSEIVRAGLKALIAMSDADFLACVSSLPVAKPKVAAKG
jgi:hypothetical protein